MIREEKIDILYNSCYGGWRISEKAIKLYNTRMKESIPGYKSINCDDNHNELLHRHDKVLIEIYHELGDEFNDKYSCSKLMKIPKIYEKYYTITEYDGLEYINIDKNKYKLDIIKEIIVNNQISTDEKINKINKLL